MFTEKEHELLKSSSYSVDIFRYRSGVEAIRIRAGRGEIIWLPYLGQQIWDWGVDGKSQKFEGFVQEPSYGRSFLQNYGAFLIHCGMTAMGNPAANDTHPQHGELPLARFDEAWIEIIQEDRQEVLSLNGRLHWHVPFVAEYHCFPSVRISSDGLSLHTELRLENPTAGIMDYMYLAHINFPFSVAKKIMSTVPFDPKHVSIRNEIIPGLSANPESIKQIEQKVNYEPELVAIVNYRDGAGESAGSILVCSDGTSRWVSQETPVLDHHVIWITHNADRGACGFHLPSTAGPEGFEREKAKGNIKHLMPGSSVTMRYACGFSDTLDEVPINGAG
ncbi:MAG: DUF4432 family protein [Rectinemataceae bacterium]|jgi:hypothetical protein